MLIAHSGNDIVEPQRYEDHVFNGLNKAIELIHPLRLYLCPDDISRLESLVLGAYTVHDLGKLCNFSQMILNQQQKGKMPNHVDAGVAYLLQSKIPCDVLRAWIVQSHHYGYDVLPSTRMTGYQALRDHKSLYDRCSWIFNYKNAPKKHLMNEYTDSILPDLIQKHNELNIPSFEPFDIKKPNDETGLFMRLALSILVSADHFDTANNYKNLVIEKSVSLNPKERLEKLDEYVKVLSINKHDAIKDEIYRSCKNSTITDKLVQCKSEVGTGKTTAIMAYALQRAIELNLRKVIYVAPFTNIISQTVETYRNALTLESEDRLEVVAEHHHQVDLLADLHDQNRNLNPDLEDTSRKISFLKKFTTDWHSPIVCTTAVQFFETLASTGTSKLKKLHQLVGSVIIIDESHSSIPSALWPMTLVWLQELTNRFGCVVVLASGSMICPWKNEQIIKLINIKLEVPSILPEELSKKTLDREKNRIVIKYHAKSFDDPKQFCDFVSTYNGPKIIVCNTVKNAAIIASCFKKLFGANYVLHLSTALTPTDRELVIEKIKQRLCNRNENWVLVATSCVESGVDLSFKYGFRENSKLMSVFQLAGRVSRNNEYQGDCGLIVFELDTKIDSIFTYNPEFAFSRLEFKRLYKEHGENLGPEHCEIAFKNELIDEIKKLPSREDPNNLITVEEMIRKESVLALKIVDLHYNVINSVKHTVIVHEEKLKEDASTIEIMKSSIQLYDKQLIQTGTSNKFKDFLVWKGKYDDFLGYEAQFER